MVYLGIPLKIPTPTPAPDHPRRGHEGAWGTRVVGAQIHWPSKGIDAQLRHLEPQCSDPPTGANLGKPLKLSQKCVLVWFGGDE